ncbi:Activator of basal transcription 1 [Gryllus bimaculatus]|nr:Activator of basal transcription 1 [Gryllus bimaculatus]
MRDNLESFCDSDQEDRMSLNGNEEKSKVVEKKKRKPGIVYLSTIPKHMNALCLRELLSQYGELGRVYLQEDIRDVNKRKLKKKKTNSRNYAEGWVEFKSKRVAKEVAQLLNNTQIGGRKKSRFYDYIWTIKYLPRFKWIHLSERLAYEKAVHKQRMRTEINQAKREADYFSLNVDKSEKLKKKLGKGQKLVSFDDNSQVTIHQRETEDQILEKKKKKNEKTGLHDSGSKNVNERDEFLLSLFS